jgi:hypothetical protein
MKPLIALALASLLMASACSFRSETVETPRPASTAVVVPDAPPPTSSTVVVTTPPPG